MHRIFSGDGWLVFPDILKSARDHCPSQRLLQQPPVLIILCILCIDVPFIVLLDGSAQSRGRAPVSQANGSFPKGTGRLSEKSPAGYPHLTIGTTPPGARASRPHAVPSVAAQFPCDVAADRPAGGNRMGPAEAEAGRRCRLIPVEEMAEAAGGFVRAGTPALPGSRHPMTSSHPGHNIAEAFWYRLSLKQVHLSSGLFVFIRVHWWFVFMNDRPFFLE